MQEFQVEKVISVKLIPIILSLVDLNWGKVVEDSTDRICRHFPHLLQFVNHFNSYLCLSNPMRNARFRMVRTSVTRIRATSD